MIIEENVLLAPYTTFHVGGPARYFAKAETLGDVVEAVNFSKEKELPIFILGAGSNILVSDNGYDGLVLLVALSRIEERTGEDGEKLFIADAGVPWDSFVLHVVEAGFFGMENLSLIPGTVGGAIVQNIGAYGREVSEFVEWVEVYDATEAEVRTLSRAECVFGYRESIFKQSEGRLVVLRAGFRFPKEGKVDFSYKDIDAYLREEGITSPTTRDVRRAVVHVRTAKFPVAKENGTAGSFFKNPVVAADMGMRLLKQYPNIVHTQLPDGRYKFSAAWIIDNILHMRGVRVGNVGCAETQALVVVNYGGATCDEIKNFAHMIEEKCFMMTNVHLEREVIFVGA